MSKQPTKIEFQPNTENPTIKHSKTFIRKSAKKSMTSKLRNSLEIFDEIKPPLTSKSSSNNNKNIKLSGAYFKITTERTKRDGRVVEKDLGIYVTGGIFLMGDDATTEFSVDLYQEPQATEDPETGQLIPPASTDPVFIKTYTSSITKNFDDIQTISILGLEDGVYYTKQGSITKKWNVAKGMIFLPEQEEDTLITFTELYAPSGYVLDKRPFTMTVGHNYSVERVENFRSNNTPYNIPKTGD